MANLETSHDASQDLLQQVQQAISARQALYIQGGNSKAFLGRHVDAPVLDVSHHRGIVRYDPTELVITARSGTPLSELAAMLEAAGQALSCEPPSFTEHATVGGMVATGLSGPRRPWCGSVRDFVLGVSVISGYGTQLRFGGEVMKNVAGYDLSRTMTGSFGCLGLITEVSLKVLPRARHAHSLSLELTEEDALSRLSEWNRQGLPISGACHVAGRLHVRLEGGRGSVEAAARELDGDEMPGGFWTGLRDHKLAFFKDERPLWRLALPDNVPALSLPGATLLDWGGTQRWLKSDAKAQTIRQLATEAGGHATCFDPDALCEPFHPLAPTLMRYHQRLKRQLDPQGVFNPGRMYPEL